MSLQHFLPAQKDRLTRVLPAQIYFKDKYQGGQSPFLPESRFTTATRLFLVLWTKLFEKLTGDSLLVENRFGELASYSASNRRLLNKLISEGLVVKWDSGRQAVDKPALPYCMITVGTVRNRYGAVLMEGGLEGQGIGDTLNEAMTVALAETLERIAISEYNPEQLLLYSVEELSRNQRSFFGKSYIYPKVDEVTPINWVRSRELVSGQTALVPASMAYMSYSAINFWETVFAPSTSNGCAAYTDTNTATLKAIYEGLERDGFLMYWLNKLAPRKIILDNTINKEILAKIKLLKEYDIELHFLDCRTEYNIPILVAVLIDNRTGGVDINATAGFDTDTLLSKVVGDALRWGTGYTRGDVSNIDRKNMRSLHDRGHLWRGGSMRNEINFFLKGETVAYKDYRQKAEFNDSAHLLQKIISIFKDRGESLYALDLTNNLARKSGLSVIRVIAPELIPMYFDEARKPLNVDRLYSFARKMGYSTKDTSKEELNQVPHPFV